MVFSQALKHAFVESDGIYHMNIPNIIKNRNKHSSGRFRTLYQGRLDTVISQDVYI